MAVEFLHEINVPFFKVASADTNNIPYLEKTAKKGLSSFYFILLTNMKHINLYRLYKILKNCII